MYNVQCEFELEGQRENERMRLWLNVHITHKTFKEPNTPLVYSSLTLKCFSTVSRTEERTGGEIHWVDGQGDNNNRHMNIEHWELNREQTTRERTEMIIQAYIIRFPFHISYFIFCVFHTRNILFSTQICIYVWWWWWRSGMKTKPNQTNGPTEDGLWSMVVRPSVGIGIGLLRIRSKTGTETGTRSGFGFVTRLDYGDS